MSNIKLLKYYKFQLNELCPDCNDCNSKLRVVDSCMIYNNLVCDNCYFIVSIREDLSIRKLIFKINKDITYVIFFSSENIKKYNDMYNSLNENNDSIFKLFKIARKYYENSIFE